MVCKENQQWNDEYAIHEISGKSFSFDVKGPSFIYTGMETEHM